MTVAIIIKKNCKRLKEKYILKTWKCNKKLKLMKNIEMNS